MYYECTLKNKCTRQALIILQSIVKNNFSKVPFSCLILFRDYWITFYNFTFWRPNFTRTSSLVIQSRSEKNYSFQIFVADMCHKSRSSQTVSHNQSLTISVKKYVFWIQHGSNKHKPLRTRDFLSFSTRNGVLNLFNQILKY